LHIEAYHSQNNNRKKEKKQRIKIPKEIYKNYKKTQRKISYFIKRKGNINISSTRHTHANFEKSKRQVEPKLTGKEQIINTSQISTDTHHTSPELSSKKTAGRSQQPARTSAGKSHCPSRKS
jgi:hypothetical protein